jgi:hypothetical protein
MKMKNLLPDEKPIARMYIHMTTIKMGELKSPRWRYSYSV